MVGWFIVVARFIAGACDETNYDRHCKSAAIESVHHAHVYRICRLRGSMATACSDKRL
jgi:hypothetical protein